MIDPRHGGCSRILTGRRGFHRVGLRGPGFCPYSAVSFFFKLNPSATYCTKRTDRKNVAGLVQYLLILSLWMTLDPYKSIPLGFQWNMNGLNFILKIFSRLTRVGRTFIGFSLLV